jgi:hypothetical protein
MWNGFIWFRIVTSDWLFHGFEHLDYKEAGEFVDYLSNHKLLKKN